MKKILLSFFILLLIILNMMICGMMFSLGLKTDWGHFVIYTTIFCLTGVIIGVLWGRWAKSKNISVLRAYAALLLLTSSIWLWLGWLLLGLLKEIGKAFSYVFPSVAILSIAIFALVLGTKTRRKKTFLYCALLLFLLQAIVFVYLACIKAEKELTIHKAIKEGWEVTTAVKEIEKYSQLKVDIKGWSRIAIALPVNHSLSRQERIPDNAIFKAGVGITQGEEGYQVSLIAIEPNGNKNKLGVWYFKRDRSRWEDITADLTTLSGRFVTLLLQVASWNPAGGKTTNDNSFVFIAKPEVTTTTSQKINVLVIIIDTLRWDRLGIHGWKRATSTFIDGLASQSIEFTRAYSVTSWTAPAIASLFTGLTPHQHGILTFEALPMSDEFSTVQSILSENGWWAGAVFGNPYIGHGTGFDHGFDEFAQMPIGQFQYGGVKWASEKAVEKINSRMPQPFFLYVHFLDPHDPYTNSDKDALSEFHTSALSKLLGFLTTTFSYADKGTGPLAYPWIKAWLNDAIQKQYDTEVYAVDKGIQKIFDALEKNGLLSNTIVIITSDHGEEFLEHGGILHGRTLYNEVLHVPLLIRLPNGEGAGTKITTPISISEISGTITTLMGTKTKLPGRNLISLSNSVAEQPIFAELLHPPHGESKTIAVIAGDKKLIYQEDENKKTHIELYFLNEDPQERIDRAPEFPDIVQEMIKLIEPLLSTPVYSQKDASRLSPDVIKKLKAIGYLR